jgi:hypothetical protein
MLKLGIIHWGFLSFIGDQLLGNCNVFGDHQRRKVDLIGFILPPLFIFFLNSKIFDFNGFKQC